MALAYFTLTELRALPDMADTAKYTDARLTAAGEWIEAIIEREVGTSFVGRDKTETLSGDDQGDDGGLKLGSPYVLSLTSITQNGVALTAPELAEVSEEWGVLVRRSSGVYTSSTPWPTGRRNIVVAYSAGYSAAPPADVKDAALQGARWRVLRTGTGAGASDRATSITNELTTIQLSTAGPDHPVGLPDVDAVIVGWRDRLNVFGFA